MASDAIESGFDPRRAHHETDQSKLRLIGFYIYSRLRVQKQMEDKAAQEVWKKQSGRLCAHGNFAGRSKREKWLKKFLKNVLTNVKFMVYYNSN